MTEIRSSCGSSVLKKDECLEMIQVMCVWLVGWLVGWYHMYDMVPYNRQETPLHTYCSQ